MGKGLNKVLLIGNLGQQPELRQTQSGKSVLSMRLATNENYQDRNGEWQDRTEWHTVVVWGKRAKSLNNILSKGSHIYVEGRNQTRSWEDRNGVKRYTTEVVAREVILLGSQKERKNREESGYDGGYGGSSGYGDRGGSGYGDDYAGDGYPPGSFTDDDVPF